MITLQGYKNILGTEKIGRIYKKQSDMIEEMQWGSTIDATVGYLYDWVRDTHQSQLNDLNPLADTYKIPIEMKFIVSSKQTYSKDPVSYHLQLRPSQECNVPYYEACFKERYAATFPCGMYVDIQDSKDRFNRWLIVGEANINDPQFPTFEILRCDYILNAVINGEKYNFPVVLRSQNSYNSGIWRD